MDQWWTSRNVCCAIPWWNMSRVNPSDSLDEYFSAVESFSQTLSRATLLSYTAAMADFDSVNNFAKEESYDTGKEVGTGSGMVVE